MNRSTTRGMHLRGFMSAMVPGIDFIAKTWNLMLTVPQGPHLNIGEVAGEQFPVATAASG